MLCLLRGLPGYADGSNPRRTRLGQSEITSSITSGDGRFSFSYTWMASHAAPYKQACDCSCPCKADPVLLSTGEMTETIIDYQTAGANKLGFTRYYNMLPNSFTGVVLLNDLPALV